MGSASSGALFFKQQRALGAAENTVDSADLVSILGVLSFPDQMASTLTAKPSARSPEAKPTQKAALAKLDADYQEEVATIPLDLDAMTRQEHMKAMHRNYCARVQELLGSNN